MKILNNKNNNFKKDLISLLNNRFDANIGNQIEKDVIFQTSYLQQDSIYIVRMLRKIYLHKLMF